LPPGVEPATHRPNVCETLRLIFFRPPGRGRFLGSGTVKENLPISGQRCFLPLEFG